VYVPDSIHSLAYDELILKFYRPTTDALIGEGLATDAFFIRYGDPSPHLRMRVQLADKRKAAHVRERIFARGIGTTRVARILQVDEAAYEPETERYGGDRALPAAEALFCESSRVVVALLAESDRLTREARLARSMDLMLLLLSAALPNPHDAACQLHDYGLRWLMTLSRSINSSDLLELTSQRARVRAHKYTDHVRRWWVPRDARSFGASPTLTSYAAGVTTLVHRLRELFDANQLAIRGNATPTWSDVVGQVVMSLAHMTSNRMGITTLEEAYLSLIAAQALEAGLAQTHHA